MDVEDLDPRLRHLRLIRQVAFLERRAQEGVGEQATSVVQVHVELDLANALTGELVGQRRMPVLQRRFVCRINLLPQRLLGRRRLDVVAVVRSDGLQLVEARALIDQHLAQTAGVGGRCPGRTARDQLQARSERHGRRDEAHPPAPRADAHRTTVSACAPRRTT